jgi:hypothetical protein
MDGMRREVAATVAKKLLFNVNRKTSESLAYSNIIGTHIISTVLGAA